MSRALNVTSSVASVEALCQKHAVAISTIEALPSGGTRVVLLNPKGAEQMRELLKKDLIETAVVRSRMHLSRQHVPR